MQGGGDVVKVIDSEGLECPTLPIVSGGGNAKVIIWPGMGAQFRTINLISLDEGASTVPLEHPGECVYYVVSGSGRVSDIMQGNELPVTEGTMIHIAGRDRYSFSAAARMVLLGGPCPADTDLLEKAGK